MNNLITSCLEMHGRQIHVMKSIQSNAAEHKRWVSTSAARLKNKCMEIFHAPVTSTRLSVSERRGFRPSQSLWLLLMAVPLLA